MAENSPKRVPGSYIDTQGMGAPLTPEEAARLKEKPVEHKPATVRPMRLITPMMAKELMILINEVLDERDGKAGISYFDTEHFKHSVDEEEPPYKPWQNYSPYRLDELQE